MRARARQRLRWLRERARQASRTVRPAQGLHKASRATGLQWIEPTPRAAPAPPMLSAPRVMASRLPMRERIMLRYDAAENAMADRIYATVMQSRLAWAQSHV
jgi:hypothetical protein